MTSIPDVEHIIGHMDGSNKREVIDALRDLAQRVADYEFNGYTADEYMEAKRASETEKAALSRRLREAETERDELRSVNEAVSVCREHTSDVVTADGCVVCKLREAEERAAKADDMFMEAMEAKWAAERAQRAAESRERELREALRALLGEGWEYIDGEFGNCSYCDATKGGKWDVEHTADCPVTKARALATPSGEDVRLRPCDCTPAKACPRHAEPSGEEVERG